MSRYEHLTKNTQIVSQNSSYFSRKYDIQPFRRIHLIERKVRRGRAHWDRLIK